MSNAMLTTTDNPFNPHTHFKEWFQFDVGHGYNTLQYQARLTFSSPYLSEADQNEAIDAAIDEIIEENILGIYEKVYPPK